MGPFVEKCLGFQMRFFSFQSVKGSSGVPKLKFVIFWGQFGWNLPRF